MVKTEVIDMMFKKLKELKQAKRLKDHNEKKAARQEAFKL